MVRGLQPKPFQAAQIDLQKIILKLIYNLAIGWDRKDQSQIKTFRVIKTAVEGRVQTTKNVFALRHLPPSVHVNQYDRVFI